MGQTTTTRARTPRTSLAALLAHSMIWSSATGFGVALCVDDVTLAAISALALGPALITIGLLTPTRTPGGRRTRPGLATDPPPQGTVQIPRSTTPTE